MSLRARAVYLKPPASASFSPQPARPARPEGRRRRAADRALRARHRGERCRAAPATTRAGSLLASMTGSFLASVEGPDAVGQVLESSCAGAGTHDTADSPATLGRRCLPAPEVHPPAVERAPIDAVHLAQAATPPRNAFAAARQRRASSSLMIRRPGMRAASPAAQGGPGVERSPRYEMGNTTPLALSQRGACGVHTVRRQLDSPDGSGSTLRSDGSSQTSS